MLKPFSRLRFHRSQPAACLGCAFDRPPVPALDLPLRRPRAGSEDVPLWYPYGSHHTLAVRDTGECHYQTSPPPFLVLFWSYGILRGSHDHSGFLGNAGQWSQTPSFSSQISPDQKPCFCRRIKFFVSLRIFVREDRIPIPRN